MEFGAGPALGTWRSRPPESPPRISHHRRVHEGDPGPAPASRGAPATRVAAAGPPQSDPFPGEPSPQTYGTWSLRKAGFPAAFLEISQTHLDVTPYGTCPR